LLTRRLVGRPRRRPTALPAQACSLVLSPAKVLSCGSAITHDLHYPQLIVIIQFANGKWCGGGVRLKTVAPQRRRSRVRIALTAGSIDGLVRIGLHMEVL